MKASDYSCVPLCGDCHTRGPGAYHRIDKPAFERKNGLSFVASVARLRRVEREVRMKGAGRTSPLRMPRGPIGHASKLLRGAYFSRENGDDMRLQELRTTKRDEILLIAARRGARNVRVFGSVARGDDDARSDIDFLVDLEPDRSLFDLSGLLIDLEAALHSHVDVVTERGLRARIRDRVLKEAVPL